MVRDARVNLQNHFRKLLKTAQTKDGIEKRIIFFIDDLDRCLPESILKVLEALKLYLNIKGCVYFLAVDKTALEESIQYHYKDMSISHVNYLDKIVQLPFNIPPIAPESIGAYINSILPSELIDCSEMLSSGLGDNPRHVKRFVNTLSLNHQLAKNLNMTNYNPLLLAVLLYIEYRNPILHRAIADDSKIFNYLISSTDKLPSFLRTSIDEDIRLKKALSHINIEQSFEEDELFPYIHLTTITSISETTPEEEVSKAGRYDLFVKMATKGNAEDVDYLMGQLEERDDIATAKLVDYCLGLISTSAGYERIKHYLKSGSSKQRNYAALYFRRKNDLKVLDQAFDSGKIDRVQAYSK